MSKYEALWNCIKNSGCANLKMSYDEIEKILGFPMDHSFLQYKKELLSLGYEVDKISMKNQTVSFKVLNEEK